MSQSKSNPSKQGAHYTLENIEFVLSHFQKQHELFPRTVMTSKLGYQKKIDCQFSYQISKYEIHSHFKQSEFMDCKINAFPYNTRYSMDLDIKNRTAATIIMIDLDLQHFVNQVCLNRQLKKTLKNISNKFQGDSHPTVLWTGNGYHIYQPIEGIIFEKHKPFYDFLSYLDGKDMTTEFLRFAEIFLSNKKSDPQHKPSINSCLLRVPGPINSKNGQEVKIIQKWDGKWPNIRWITSDFLDHLIEKRNSKINEKKSNKFSVNSFSHYARSDSEGKIIWIEKLLQTPLGDHRRYCIFHILVPYLVNVKKLSSEEVSMDIVNWLSKCNVVKPLDFNPSIEIKNRIKYVRNFRPMSIAKLRIENAELHRLISKFT